MANKEMMQPAKWISKRVIAFDIYDAVYKHPNGIWVFRPLFTRNLQLKFGSRYRGMHKAKVTAPLRGSGVVE